MRTVEGLAADPELLGAIVDGLPRLLDGADAASIDLIEIRPSQYRTSFPLDEVDVTLSDGRRARLLRKHLRLSALEPGIAAAKHAGMFNAQREVEIYHHVLVDAGLGTAAFIGTGSEADGSGQWLLLEHVQGIEMYQVGDLQGWRAAAAWLATMHERLAWVAADGALPRAELFRHGPDSWERSMHRAQQLGLSALPARARQRLSAAHRVVIDVLGGVPVRLLHGDAYASNILLDDPRTPRRVCAVDWEMASVGPTLLDLAALTAGTWSLHAMTAIAGGYFDALPEASVWHGDRAAFDAALEACRLQIAVQWLGWPAGWIPPPDHSQDWAAVALTGLERMGL